DIVVNNAGDQRAADLADTDPDTWHAVLSANVVGAMELARHALPHLAHDAGSVVNVASVEAIDPSAGHGAYAASKAALVQATRAAALEWGPRGVRVNAVLPGLIERPGIAEQWPEGVGRWTANAPLGRMGRGDDVGDACVFLASPLASFVTGAALAVDGGLSAQIRTRLEGL
ncbi:MAG: SDR family oxidoreductase, partial [Rhodobacteraceae bacterium]|nr:SDR family oxidoreductase [Paracoccaceae bacterium]